MAAIAETLRHPGSEGKISPQGIAVEEFWSILGKESLPQEEISIQFPQILPQIETYRLELGHFLSQEPVAQLSQNLHLLQSEIRTEKERFASSAQELGRRKDALVETMRETANAKRRKEGEIGEIGSERGDAILIVNRFRVAVRQRRDQPGRGLRERLLAITPGFALEEHPLLTPFTQALKRLQQDIAACEEENRLLRENYQNQMAPWQEDEQQKRERANRMLADWVASNPQRLLAHLCQFPSEVSLFRKVLRKYRKKDPQFEITLRNWGLLPEEIPKEIKVSTRNLITPSSIEETPESIIGPEWGFVFPIDPDKVYQTDEEIREAVKEIFRRNNLPSSSFDRVVRNLLALRRDLKGRIAKSASVKGKKAQIAVGRFKIRSGDIRIFYDPPTSEEGQRIIRITEIMTHDAWNKLQR